MNLKNKKSILLILSTCFLSGCNLFSQEPVATEASSSENQIEISETTITTDEEISLETTNDIPLVSELTTTSFTLQTSISETELLPVETTVPVSEPLITEVVSSETEPKRIKCSFEATVTNVKDGKLYVTPDPVYDEKKLSDEFIILYNRAFDFEINDVVKIVYYDDKIDKNVEPIRIESDDVSYVKTIDSPITEVSDTTTEIETQIVSKEITPEEYADIYLDDDTVCNVIAYHDIFVKDVTSPVFTIDSYDALCSIFRNKDFQETIDNYYDGNFYIGPMNYFNTTFFNDHSLIALKEVRDNKTAKVNIVNIVSEENQITIYIKEDAPTEETNEMSYNLFFISLPKDYSKNKDIIIKYEDKNIQYN